MFALLAEPEHHRPLHLGPQIPLLLKQAKQNPFISGKTAPSRAQRVCV